MNQRSDQHLTDHNYVAKGTEVFVGGLSRSISEEKIREVFSTCGDIMEIRLIKDPKGNLKGFCFVRFATKEAAARAVKEKSGAVLDGKKIGVLPSSEQDTLYFGNLNKAWSAEEFERLVLQVFPDVESIDLVMHKNGPSQKHQNRGFAFVKFVSHVAASRAHRVACQPEFRLGNANPAIQWAEDESQTDPKELAKIKVAFVRNLPVDAKESYLKQLFEQFGEVEKVLVSKKGSYAVGFVHFTERSDLERAVKELNNKTVQLSGGVPYKLQVEIARPMEKNKKRVRETAESKSPAEGPSKLVKEETSVPLPSNHYSHVQMALESADRYEDAVVALPLAVKERLLRILRLGIATQYDINIKSLHSLKELPESLAISILDQLMISGASVQDKGAYLDGLISKGLNYSLASLSKVPDVTRNESRLFTSSRQVSPPAVGSFMSHARSTMARPDIYSPNYPSMLPDYPFPNQTPIGRLGDRDSDFRLLNRSIPGSQSIHIPKMATLEERGHSPLDATMPYGRVGLRTDERYLSPPRAAPSASTPYARLGASLSSDVIGQQSSPSHIRGAPGSLTSYARLGASSKSAGMRIVDQQPSRPQMRFDPFTGEPYKFDPFTGEPINHENTTDRL